MLKQAKSLSPLRTKVEEIRAEPEGPEHCFPGNLLFSSRYEGIDMKQASLVKAGHHLICACALCLFATSGYSRPYLFSSIAGQAGKRGTADGTNNGAHFYQPRCLAVDLSGNLFVTDDTTVRRVRLVGTNYVVTTIAGTPRTAGGSDGTNGGARFTTAGGIAIDAATNLYVADYGSHTIRKLTPLDTNWVVTTVAGLSGVAGSADGVGTNALFNNPFGLCRDSAGNLLVADSGNDTVRKVSPQGTDWVVTTVAGSPTHS